MKSWLCVLAVVLTSGAWWPAAADQPNIILIYTDDISAREFPIYGSTKWSPAAGGDSQDPADRASTPVIDRIAQEGVWVKDAWGATICSPSRAMLMTGRYAHRHKWWRNGDFGTVQTPEGPRTWNLYESSPMLISHVARDAGYKSLWLGKTQMTGDILQFGFDEGVFTAGHTYPVFSPHTSFRLEHRNRGGKRELYNIDTGEAVETYLQASFFWKPSVQLMNRPGTTEPLEWWPNTPESKAAFGLNTYGPDVIQDAALEFIERQHAAGKPFFIYHTSNLGHDAFDWTDPVNDPIWPATPKIRWDGQAYHRTDPNITGSDGEYDGNGTLASASIKSHVEYLDYQVWQYLNKLEALGIADNTVVIFTSDNGTLKYGKGWARRQRGTQVPFIVYAPGRLTKQGEQEILVDLADVLPTLADIMGVDLPAHEDYPLDGKNLWPYLTTDRDTHRPWIFSYESHMQLARGHLVMKDGIGAWWDVEHTPDDLDSYREITDWSKVSKLHRYERDRLKEVMEKFDLHATEHDAPESAAITE